MDMKALAGREGWLSDFFGGGNVIRWADLVAGSSAWSAALRPWLALVATGRGDQGLVLPAQAVHGPVVWHACAATRQDRAALAEQLASFLGPARAETLLAPEPGALAPLEQVLVQRFGGPVQRLVARAGTDPTDMGQTLAMLAELLLRRPPRRREVQRPFAAVRAEFEQALLTPDEDRARRCIDELRSTGRLSAANERFLHVRLMVAMGREAALVQDGALMALLADAELPIRVLREVIEALYTVHLAPLDDGLPVDAWMEAFRQHVRRHERLLRSRRGLRAPAALRIFLLHEMARAPDEVRAADVAGLHEALSALPQQRAWADKVLHWWQARGAAAPVPIVPAEAPPPAPVVPEAPAAQAPTAPDLPVTVAQWALLAPSTRALTGLLQAAMAVGTLEAAAQALVAVQAYPRDLLQGLSPIQRGLLDMLADLVPAEPVPVSDWTDWARWWVGASADQTERALAIAEQGAEQWDHAAWFANTGKVREFATLLQAQPTRFRPYLATIHASLYDIQDVASAQADVLVQMAMVVALDAPQPADLPLLADWAAWLVHLGAGRALCDEMAGALHAAWSEVRSLRCLDWACDVVEWLASAPRTPGGALESLFSDVIGLASGQQHRLTAAQQRVLALLAQDFGLQFAPPEASGAPAPEPSAGPPAYADVSIGIYTLQESIVAHLRAALKAAFPGARVEFNHDHVATPALEHMARSSDVMVFAWRCSKHQAFYCVQQQRPVGRPLLQPQGRGSASILRELERHFGLYAGVT